MTDIESFLLVSVDVVGQPLPVARRFCERLHGMKSPESRWLWLPDCCWVHGKGMKRRLMLAQPSPALGRLKLTQLPPGALGYPWTPAAGTLEMEMALWSSCGPRLLAKWWEDGWEIF